MADHKAKAASQLQSIDDLLAKCSHPNPPVAEYCASCIKGIQTALDIALLHKLPEKQLEILHHAMLHGAQRP
jgi:hypothetical protein